MHVITDRSIARTFDAIEAIPTERIGRIPTRAVYIGRSSSI